MKNFILAILSGLLLAFGWPVNGFPLLLFFGFAPLLLAEFNIRNSKAKFIKWKVFGISYLAFFIWNLLTTYWIYFSTPFGGAFAVLANSLLMSIVFLIYHIVAKRTGFKSSASFFISFWIVFEKIHLGWEFSWPWLNLGNAFSEYINLVQWYEFTGTFGGTLWILLINFIIFKAIISYSEFKEPGILYRAALKSTLLVGFPILASYIILWNYEMPKEKITALILQPNINPYTEKYNTNDTKIGDLLLNMSEENITDSTAIVLAPETVFADGTVLPRFDNSEAAFFGRQIASLQPNLSFLGGASFYERFSDSSKVGPQSNKLRANDWFNDYNSAFLINNFSENQIYHKSKLVVGVENFPYQHILKPILGDVMIDLGGTVAMKTTQPERNVFNIKDSIKTAPIICYESIYGEYVTGYVKNGAQFLSIITNDAWWGNTAGHRQHASYAKLRAIETRRSVARSANTGISEIITPIGEVRHQLGYEKRGTLSGDIFLNNRITFYTEHGDYIARISKFLALFIFLFAIVGFKRSKYF
ncbi:apolipoprotein N-acyltransferase [Zunongwangia atlantica]|uniref:Apolipoprotein N-acyltransferase n=1 Tax=Zunongwangia atlantica 22II14-10F7 TaxID=1185767 RepID=A0A1Y1T8R6_9FLAO|nr:apolipoprotein N-acyltransferase [Zunongwangia atlantica]ORL47449.1 apolipoprotein N-acyltransferase [Zunongwangia atlantica 22II14-10F7]